MFTLESFPLFYLPQSTNVDHRTQMSVPSNDLMRSPPSWSARIETFLYLHIFPIGERVREKTVPSCHEIMNG